jgi:CHAT domain-containing protein/Tfp pilus assembly protein PilF
MLISDHHNKPTSWQHQRAAEPRHRIPRKASLPILAVLAALVLAACGTRTDPVRTVDALRSQNKTTEALQAAERAIGQRHTEDHVYWELALRKAELLEKLNRREEALAWLQKILPPRTAPSDLAVLLLREEAAVERALGKFRDSDQHLSAAIEFAGRTNQSRMAANLKVRRAYVLIQLERVPEAEQCLSQAEECTRASQDHSLDPYIQHYRGSALVATNQFEQAIAPLTEALKAARQANQRPVAAERMSSLAWVYFRLGQFDKSLALYREALGLVDPDDRHLVLGHLGNVFWEQHNLNEAAAHYEQAIGMARGRNRDFEVKWLNNLTGVLIDQGRWQEAERFNREALELENGIDSSQSRAMSAVEAGRIDIHKGNFQEAERILKETAGSRANISAVLDAYAALADLYARMGRWNEARTQFETALELADQTGANLREDENKLSYLSSLIYLHRKYVNFLMDRGDKELAFAVAESSRARVLRERLNLPGSTTRTHSIAEYRAAARRGGATFLAYWIGPEQSYLWVISATQFAAYSLPAEREIANLVERHQSSFEHGGTPRMEASSAGAKLFQCLLAQHSGVLKPGDKYLIVPDGPLYALNFETLPVPNDRPHFWIEDATVAVAPSLDLLLARHAPARRDRSLLLIGDAVEWNSEFPKLLNARKEMESVERQFPERYRKVLAGADATPIAYQSSQPARYAYIHFAAHATANKNSPFDSAIVLSRGTTGGKLSVKEVLSTPVDAELVTISACHSAGARTYGGEGLVGFAWAFLQSGAHDVIAGLWDVSDYSSPRLMQDFYAGLAASKEPSQSLRAAKVQLIRSGKFTNPYYWGAFQLYQGALDLR